MRLRSYFIASTLLLSTGTASSSSSGDTAVETPPEAIIADATTAVPPPPPEVVIVPEEFLNACTQGDITGVEAFLQANPDYLNGRSADGETCLHVAGIYGHAKIAELVLKAGGDPNIRSTFAGGLRMPPLTWNVFGGHTETTKVLLEHGAHVNLDFDSPNDSTKKVTVYDVLMEILDRGGDPQQQQQQQAKEENGMDRYWELKQVLEKHGAKRYADLAAEL